MAAEPGTRRCNAGRSNYSKNNKVQVARSARYTWSYSRYVRMPSASVTLAWFFRRCIRTNHVYTHPLHAHTYVQPTPTSVARAYTVARRRLSGSTAARDGCPMGARPGHSDGWPTMRSPLGLSTDTMAVSHPPGYAQQCARVQRQQQILSLIAIIHRITVIGSRICKLHATQYRRSPRHPCRRGD